MHPHSSSTFSSDPGIDQATAGGNAHREEIRDILSVCTWVVFFLVAIDIAINLLFPFPTDPRTAPTNSFQVYFDHGRSIEGKIRRLIGPTDETSGPVVPAGWLDDIGTGQPVRPQRQGGLLVSIYGMSFSNQVGSAMAAIDPRITLRMIGGPGAPPNHSYAAFLLDRKGRSEVVILGILSSAVVGMATTNGMTRCFEGPAPFTYPRYHVGPSGIDVRWPQVRTLQDMRDRLGNRTKWSEYVNELRAEDDYYDSFLFDQNLTDLSAIARLIRRAWGQRHQGSMERRIHSPKGFDLGSEEIRALQLMVSSFASTTRQDRNLPVVLLIQDRGYRDHLYMALQETLEQDAIPSVSTHSIVPNTDPKNFIADGHFTPEANRKIAQAVLEKINLLRTLDQGAGRGG